METIYISDKTNNFYIARWLWLKKRITQAEMVEYAKKSREELITLLNDYGFKVKINTEKKAIYTPKDSELLD